VGLANRPRAQAPELILALGSRQRPFGLRQEGCLRPVDPTDRLGHERPFQKAVSIDIVDGYRNPGERIVSVTSGNLAASTVLIQRPSAKMASWCRTGTKAVDDDLGMGPTRRPEPG
jgi:hypothetical protein